MIRAFSQRDDGIVVTGQDQGGRPQPRQPREAGPAEAREQLVIVAPGPPRACRDVQQVTGQGRVLPRAAPVQLTGDARRVSRVQVATRRDHAQQDPRIPRDHERARPGRHQHQAAHPVGPAQRELLREPAAPGDAQDIGLPVAELVEQASQPRRRGAKVVGDDRAGELPMPGMSNLMTGRCGSSASTNGWSASRLAPMPLQSSSGGTARTPIPHRDPHGPAAGGQYPHPLSRSNRPQPPSGRFDQGRFPGGSARSPRNGTGQWSWTYVPGASQIGASPPPPSSPGAALSSPQRSASQPA